MEILMLTFAIVAMAIGFAQLLENPSGRVWKKFAIILVFAVLPVGWAVVTHLKLQATNDRLVILLTPANQARTLLDQLPSRHLREDRGVMLAGLTFFENHRDAFPESYETVRRMCIALGLLEPMPDYFEGGAQQSFNLRAGSNAVVQMLEAIAAGATAK